MDSLSEALSYQLKVLCEQMGMYRINLNESKISSRLPMIQVIRTGYWKKDKGKIGLRLVIDIDYHGGGLLTASFAILFSFLHASIQFRQFQGKIVFKLEPSPMLSVSLMVSDIPKYFIHLEYGHLRLFKIATMIHHFIQRTLRQQAIFPNYCTFLMRSFARELKDLLIEPPIKMINSSTIITIIEADFSCLRALKDSCLTCTVSVNGVKHRTLSVCNTLRPQWNSTFMYTQVDLPISDTYLQVKVYSRGNWSKELIGQGHCLFTRNNNFIKTISLSPHGGNVTVQVSSSVHIEDGIADRDWIFWNMLPVIDSPLKKDFIDLRTIRSCLEGAIKSLSIVDINGCVDEYQSILHEVDSLDDPLYSLLSIDLKNCRSIFDFQDIASIYSFLMKKLNEKKYSKILNYFQSHVLKNLKKASLRSKFFSVNHKKAVQYRILDNTVHINLLNNHYKLYECVDNNPNWFSMDLKTEMKSYHFSVFEGHFCVYNPQESKYSAMWHCLVSDIQSIRLELSMSERIVVHPNARIIMNLMTYLKSFYCHIDTAIALLLQLEMIGDEQDIKKVKVIMMQEIGICINDYIIVKNVDPMECIDIFKARRQGMMSFMNDDANLCFQNANFKPQNPLDTLSVTLYCEGLYKGTLDIFQTYLKFNHAYYYVLPVKHIVKVKEQKWLHQRGLTLLMKNGSSIFIFSANNHDKLSNYLSI